MSIVIFSNLFSVHDMDMQISVFERNAEDFPRNFQTDWLGGCQNKAMSVMSEKH